MPQNPELEEDDDDAGFTLPLSRTYAAREGAPVVTHVAPRIFTQTYFQPCFGCGFCNDSCCQYGVAVDLPNQARINAHAEGIAPMAGGKPDQWWKKNHYTDKDFPGARAGDTEVVGRGCVFLRPDQRGCSIHAYCLDKGIDYHDIKPVYCSLFPLTVDSSYLVPSVECDEKSLVCVDHGTTLYRGSRDELLYYFGQELVDELDALEKKARSGEVSTAPPVEFAHLHKALPVLQTGG
jgi:Fe-S-cluster containining protein